MADAHRIPRPPESEAWFDSAWAARACILAAALLWSTNGLFAKATIFSAWPPTQRGLAFAFWRALFAALIVLPMVRRPRWNWRLIPMTVCFTGMNVCFLQAMTLTTAANAIWLQSTAPLWVFLWQRLVLRVVPQRRDLGLVLTGLAGVGLILGFELAVAHERNEPPLGVAYGLASGLLYAGVVQSLRTLRTEDSAWLVFLNHLAPAVVLLPAVLLLAPRPNGTQLGVLVGFGMLQMGLPYLLFTRGLRCVSSQEGAGIGLLEPVLTPLWVWLAWGEAPRWWTLAGGGLILAGLIQRYSGPSWRRGSGSAVEFPATPVD